MTAAIGIKGHCAHCDITFNLKPWQLNAIAIEEPGSAIPITTYYRNWIITPGGFVVTARGLQDYAETLRLKLLRELTKPIG